MTLQPLTSLTSLSSDSSSAVSAGASAVSNAVSSAASSAASSAVSSATSSVGSWFTQNGGRIIAVVLGLLFIAAGIFQFEKVQQTLGAAAKTAAVV